MDFYTTRKKDLISTARIVGGGIGLGGLVVWILTLINGLALEVSSSILMIAFVLMSGVGMLLTIWVDDLLAPQYLLPSIYLFAFGIGSYLLNIKAVNLGTEGFPVTLTQWFYYILAIAAFLTGFGCSRLLFFMRKSTELSRVRWDFNRLLVVIIIFGLAGTITRYLVFLRVGIPILSQNVDVLRSSVRDVGGVLVTLTWFSNVSVHLGSYFVLAAKVNKFIKVSIGVFSLFMIGTMLLSGGRQQAAVAVIAFVIMYHYSRAKLGLKDLILFVFLAFVFIGGLGAYRIYARYGQEYITYLRSQGIPVYLSWLPEAAKQLSMGADGFAFVVQTIPNRVGYRFGWVALSPILHFLPGRQLLLDDWIKQISGGEWAGFGRPVSMLGGFYVDGGSIGIFLGMFLVGFMIYLAYNKVKAGNSPIWLLLFALWMPRLMSAWRGSLSAPYEIVLGPTILVLTHFYVQRSSIANSENKVEAEALAPFQRSVRGA
jgi:oligosaccharide repeat unit polymerase